MEEEQLEEKCLIGCRTRVLDFLQSQTGLLFISVLVILECLCVLALMITEIQILRLQISNEKKYIDEFERHLVSVYENKTLPKMTNIYQVLTFLREDTDILKPCPSKQRSKSHRHSDAENPFQPSGHLQDFDNKPKGLPKFLFQNKPYKENRSRNKVSNTSEVTNMNISDQLDKVLLIQLQDHNENLFVVGQLRGQLRPMVDVVVDRGHIQNVQTASDCLSIAGIVVLSLMLVEIAARIFCKGKQFFRRKFEVFDAAIVLVSFSADVSFLEDSWYKPVTDVTTILILLLPWRLVRIIYSMISTLNNKHQLHVRQLKDARQKAEDKVSKAKTIIMCLQKEVELLSKLCKKKGAKKSEIASCHKSGCGQVQLATLSTFSSMVLVSAPVCPDAGIFTNVASTCNVLNNDGNNNVLNEDDTNNNVFNDGDEDNDFNDDNNNVFNNGDENNVFNDDNNNVFNDDKNNVLRDDQSYMSPNGSIRQNNLFQTISCNQASLRNKDSGGRSYSSHL